MTEQEWISVDERLPENEVDVLVCQEVKLFSSDKTLRNVIIAFRTDGKHKEKESLYDWSKCDFEFDLDEKTGEYDVVPEDWWEQISHVDYDYREFYVVEGRVTHWMPLPGLPDE